MLTNYRSVYKSWVFSQQNEKHHPVGRIVDFVINPDNGHFEAIWIESQHGLRLLAPQDILRWDESELIIHAERDLANPKGFPRLKPILAREVPLLGAKVFSGEKFIGRVKDFAFDTISPKLLSLLVGPRWWFLGTKQVIPRKRIQKIKSQGIWISENIIPISKKKETPIPLENPIPKVDS